jgi:2-polyprenyl-3-methyl-5-hydroxy-6-metoxy-1,4-benzoquinol methylase
MRVLDIGCGFGLFVSLAQDQGWEAHGVDLSDVAVSYAREVRGVASVQRCSLEQAGFSDSFFDAVTMWNVLEHVSDPLATLRQVHKLLRQGGVLLVRVPNMAFHHAVQVCGPLLPLAGIRTKPRYLGGISPPKHLFGFNPRTLTGVLERAGFRPLSIEPAIHYRKKSNRLVPILEAVSRTVYVSSFKRSVVSPTMLAYARRA